MEFSRPETGVGNPTQGLNPGLLHCKWILYQLSPKGSPHTHCDLRLFTSCLMLQRSIPPTSAVLGQLCLTLCDPMDRNPPGSPVHGILQARTLEWVAMSSSRGSSQSRDWTQSPAFQVDPLPSEPRGNPSLLLDCQLFQDKKRVLFFLTTPHVLDRILHLVCDKHLIWGQLKPPNHPTWKLQLTKFLISLHFQSINWSSRFCFLISTKPSPPL